MTAASGPRCQRWPSYLIALLLLSTSVAGFPTSAAAINDQDTPLSSSGFGDPGAGIGAATGRILAPTHWNGLANALGGFSTSFIHSPQLNVSWISRPAGFGPRIAEANGLKGVLEGIERYAPAGTTPQKAVKGCQIDLEKRFVELETQTSDEKSDKKAKDGTAPRIALVERGDCPFVTKLLNAQALSYSAVIVYNDEAHATQPNSPFSSNYEEDELISMWSPSREANLLDLPSTFVAYNTGKTLENLMHIAENHDEHFEIIMEAEEPPHLLLMDVIIMLFFLPTVFTTLVIATTKARQYRQRRRLRAPKALVDSLPSFQWSENLSSDIAALDIAAEKAATSGSQISLGQGKGGGERPTTKLVKTLSKALKMYYTRRRYTDGRRSPTSDSVEDAPATISTSKARTLARKIFSQRECAICLSDFIKGDNVKLLPCGHIFHVDEIDDWLVGQKRWCPVCRCSIDGSLEGEGPTGTDAQTGSADLEAARTAAAVPPASPVAQAQPILSREDLFDPANSSSPIAGSSTGTNERTPLLSRTL